MLLLQTTFDIIGFIELGYIIAGALASFLTFAMQKILSWKQDKTTLLRLQSKAYKKVMQDLAVVVERYRKHACFRTDCKKRINGDDDDE